MRKWWIYLEAWITRQRMPETYTTRGAGKRGMMLINDGERTMRALCDEIALAGRTSVMGKRAVASGPCGNGGSTWKVDHASTHARDAHNARRRQERHDAN